MDHQVLLHGNLSVAVLDLHLYPFAELLVNHRGDDVAYPLLGRLGNLKLWLWQILEDILVMLLEELQDLFYAKAIVHGGIERVRIRGILKGSKKMSLQLGFGSLTAGCGWS